MEKEKDKETSAGKVKYVIDLSIRILEVSKGKYCVDFTRNEGDTLAFFE